MENKPKLQWAVFHIMGTFEVASGSCWGCAAPDCATLGLHCMIHQKVA